MSNINLLVLKLFIFLFSKQPVLLSYNFPHLQENFIWEIRQLAKCPNDIIKRGIYLNLLTDGGPGTLLVGDDGLLQHRVQHNPLHRSDSRPLLPKHLRTS